MSDQEIEKMRQSVRDYFERFLELKAFAATLIRLNWHKIIVNAEEKSVPMVYSKFVWPPV